MKENKIAIILVNWDGIQDTLACIESLNKCTVNNFEIFVVDNASNISPEAILTQKYPAVHFIASPINLGFAAGNNLALDKINADEYEFVLFLNNDTLVAPDFISPLRAAFENNPNIVAVQPCIFYEKAPNKIWNAGGIWNQWIGDSFSLKKNQTNNTISYCDWLTGCAILAKTATLKKLGGFDPSFFAYYEDVDLSFRLRQDGRQLAMVPKSIIWHKVGSAVQSSLGKEGKQQPLVHFWNWRNRIWVIRKYQNIVFLILNFPFLIVQLFSYSLYFITKRRWTKLKFTWKGFIAGWFDSMN